MLPTLLWDEKDNQRAQCRVCGHNCVIPAGSYGVCRTRRNENGRVVSQLTDLISSLQIDPVEKKPLYHFLPGTKIFSVGGFGCNFRCRFCQNSHISVLPKQGSVAGRHIDAATLLSLAKEYGAKSIAFTYNEPTLSLELIHEAAQRAETSDLPIVLVSNGYMSGDFLALLGKHIRAINVDLKSFRDAFYAELCGAHLNPVLDTLKAIAKTQTWLEVTTLVIPHVNDSREELKDCADFIRKELGSHVPWHLSAFHGAHKMQNHPSTTVAQLEAAWEIGKEAGLEYVYMGNVLHPRGANTYCPSCSALLIERTAWTIRPLCSDGKCPSCGREIPGVWR